MGSRRTRADTKRNREEMIKASKEFKEGIPKPKRKFPKMKDKQLGEFTK
jgi:hypothetical protein